MQKDSAENSGEKGKMNKWSKAHDTYMCADGTEILVSNRTLRSPEQGQNDFVRANSVIYKAK